MAVHSRLERHSFLIVSIFDYSAIFPQIMALYGCLWVLLLFLVYGVFIEWKLEKDLMLDKLPS